MKRKYMILSIILSLVILITGTYAWLTWSSEENTNFTLSLGEVGEVLFSGGNEISSSGMGPVLSEEEGVYTEFQILKKTDTSFNVIINFLPTVLPDELKEESFKYALFSKESEDDIYTLVTEGNFSDKEEGIEFTITSAEITVTTYYKLVIYIDGNMSNPIDMQGQDFAGTVIVSYEEAVSNVVLSTYITDIYNNATKTSVENNSVTYEYAKDISMMTDVGGNIRYYGADPDNYIYFNCETYPNTNCEKWRIIGIFDGKIKLMRNESIGSYSWDTSASGVNSGYGINQWGESTYTTGSAYEGADLMRLLNPGYESNSVNNSLYYNGKSGKCYNSSSNTSTTCDFSSTGLKNDETRNMISETQYYLGGYYSSSVYPKEIYTSERGNLNYGSFDDRVSRTTTWTGRIALPYPSDYGYAADLSTCTQTLASYSDSTCTSNNWMKSIFTSNSWLITPYSSSPGHAWRVLSSGNYYYYNTGTANGVAPTLYLDPNTVIDLEVGTGDVDDPYRIIIS